MAFLEFLMQFRTPILDQIALAISMLGTPFFMAGIIAWYYYNIDKKKAYGMSLAFLYTGLIGQGMKLIFRVPRPWVLEPDTDVFKPVQSALSTATGYSFPSIHTQSTTAVATAVVTYTKKHVVRIIACVLTVLILFSRMYLGVHTPADVLTAFFFTLVISLVTLRLWNRFGQSRKRNDELFAFFSFGFSVILIFLAAALTANGTVEFKLAKDAFETAGVGLGFAISFVLERNLIHFSTDGSKMQKVIRFLLAIAGAGVLEFGMKALFEETPILVTVRYALMGFWIFGAAPVLAIRAKLMKRIR